ncbi:MAG: hypothetical protein EA367_06010 [Leptolyngbya sp. DLM2.Bin15]|nr:MAG: hypothetical protein EA367_06010 [Leptolyngbya sp. DLM2.Bin15]
MALSRPARKRSLHKNLWFERGMAMLALVNLGLLAFDLSYVPFRDFYLRNFPEFTATYGERFKGMEPHRATTAYLETVAELEAQVAEQGLSSSRAGELLENLRILSDEMVDENPFAIANKSGTLERIKNRMRDRTDNDSAKQAFNEFWTTTYLSEAGWSDSMRFFREDIAPLIATNYFRGIGEDGRPTDDFWLIDRWFIGVLGLEFLLRTIYLSRRYNGTNWLDAIIWRWYDLFFFIPLWRWLRVIPVTVRLGQAKLVNIAFVTNRIRRALVTHFAIELTEIVILRTIDQIQNLIRDGEVRQFLLQSSNTKSYVNLNGINEMEVISQHVSELVLDHVLPQVKPEIDALLSHSVTSAFQGTPLYQGLINLPNFERSSDQLVNGMVSQLSDRIYAILRSVMEDEKGAELSRNVITSFIKASRQEAISQEQTVEEIESLLGMFLEEVKVNYVKRLSEEDLEALQEQAQDQFYELI